MVLKASDFAGWRINWGDKVENIVELARELGLGLESVVFVDDNVRERARVAEALPEVLVPEWPEDPLLYVAALHELRCFDSPRFSDEDRKRALMYSVERQRREEASAFGSAEEWLKTLQISIEVEPLNERNLDRVTQLFNKTNQMNLTTRRLSAAQLMAWSGTEGRTISTFRVSDRLGDLGLTGILGLECDGDIAVMTDFVLSCRVIGRKVEEAMLATAIEQCRAQSCRELRLVFIPTPKNGPCLASLRRSGFEERPTHVFTWKVAARILFPISSTWAYALPAYRSDGMCAPRWL